MTQSSSRSPNSFATLSLRTDRPLVRAEARSRRYALATIGAPEAPPRTDRIPVNVALVLDRSGSMSGENKFELARQAVEQALGMLRPEDRFSLVVYDNEVDVLASSRAATHAARREAIRALRDVSPRGTTDLSGAWFRGCEQVAALLSDQTVSRVMLLTDGLANCGIMDRGELAYHASELRQRGIATSTFGVGSDFDERLLRDMAHEGGGNFYFISSPTQIADVLTSELGEALEVVMRRAALHVVLPAGVEARTLNRYRHTMAAGDRELRIELGDLVSGQELELVLELTFPRGRPGDATEVRAILAENGALATHAEGLIRWTFANHRENDLQQRDVRVDREVARLYAAIARADATEANRRGDFDLARNIIDGTVRRIRSYARNDSALLETATSLNDVRPEFVDGYMSQSTLKQHVYVAEMAVKSRSMAGRARRRR